MFFTYDFGLYVLCLLNSFYLLCCVVLLFVECGFGCLGGVVTLVCLVWRIAFGCVKLWFGL